GRVGEAKTEEPTAHPRKVKLLADPERQGARLIGSRPKPQAARLFSPRFALLPASRAIHASAPDVIVGGVFFALPGVGPVPSLNEEQAYCNVAHCNVNVHGFLPEVERDEYDLTSAGLREFAADLSQRLGDVGAVVDRLRGAD